MYRGDDVYLFDFWPLDNLNTVGGGAMYSFNRRQTSLALHRHEPARRPVPEPDAAVPSRRLPPDASVLGLQPATVRATTLDRRGW